MTFSAMVEFWLAQHLAGLIVGAAILVVVVGCALVETFIVEPVKRRRKARRNP